MRRSWDQSHTFNAGVGWTQAPWQATVAAQYHTGWPVTPIGLDDAGDVVLGRRNDDRYADFASVDARVSYEWTLPRGTLTAHAEVTNALDRGNPCCTDLYYVADATGLAQAGTRPAALVAARAVGRRALEVLGCLPFLFRVPFQYKVPECRTCPPSPTLRRSAKAFSNSWC